MSPRRRAVLLGGLALVLGALAASDMAGREAALRRSVGDPVPVVVARRDLEPGVRLAAADLAVRRVPARYAPAGAVADPRQVEGLRVMTAVAAGADLDAGALSSGTVVHGAPVRAGERLAELSVAGSVEGVGPGARVDVLVTSEGKGGTPGRTVLALEDVEVVGAAPGTDPSAGGDKGSARTVLTLRVALRDAVYLAAAQAFAREVRVLPRAAGDTRRGSAGLAVDEGL